MILPCLAFIGAFCALRRRHQKGLLLIAVLLFYPLVHYITHTAGGFVYQYPIHPEMLALAASVFWSRRNRNRNDS